MITKRNYQGQKFGDWRVFEYEADTGLFFIQHTNGKVHKATPEFVEEQIEKEKHLNSYTGKFVMPSDNFSDAYAYAKKWLVEPALQRPFANTPNPTPKTMTRLTSYNDWTILLEDNKLVAVNSSGNTVRAKGALLSAGGRAWMYTNGQLWSGELERHETEKETRDNATLLAAEKIREKHNKKIALAEKKLDELNAAKSQALRNL